MQEFGWPLCGTQLGPAELRALTNCQQLPSFLKAQLRRDLTSYQDLSRLVRERDSVQISPRIQDIISILAVSWFITLFILLDPWHRPTIFLLA